MFVIQFSKALICSHRQPSSRGARYRLRLQPLRTSGWHLEAALHGAEKPFRLSIMLLTIKGNYNERKEIKRLQSLVLASTRVHHRTPI